MRLEGRGEGPPCCGDKRGRSCRNRAVLGCSVPQPGHMRGTGPAFHIWFDLVVFIKKADSYFFLLHSPQLHSKQLPSAQPPVTSLHTKGGPQRTGKHCRSLELQVQWVPGYGCSWLCLPQGAGL